MIKTEHLFPNTVAVKIRWFVQSFFLEYASLEFAKKLLEGKGLWLLFGNLVGMFSLG